MVQSWRTPLMIVLLLAFLLLVLRGGIGSSNYVDTYYTSSIVQQQHEIQHRLNVALNRLEEKNRDLQVLIQEESERLHQLKLSLKDGTVEKNVIDGTLHYDAQVEQEVDEAKYNLDYRPVISVKAKAETERAGHIIEPDRSWLRPSEQTRTNRQDAVVSAFQWAWKGYKEFAWGHDELLPVTRKSSEWFGLGLTLIDALDTMIIMGIDAEYQEARQWVAAELQLDKNTDVNLFECTIRVLGGLLSSYALTGDVMFKERALDLGQRLQHAFNDESGVPYSDVNLQTMNAHKPKWGPDSSTAEVTTIQLEFKYLAHITKQNVFHERVSRIMEHLRLLPKKDGLVPIFINANTGRFSGNTITLGARGDSYYEYLLKQWLLTNKNETVYKDMYLEAVNGIKKHLLKRTEHENLLYVAELINGRISPKMDHLVCFLPGTLALGTFHGLPQEHLDIAKELMKTCYEMYARQPLGLAPEIVHFNMGPQREDIYVKPADAHNLLRPETVESLFILYRVTSDKQYQDWGWNIFQHFEKHCKVSTGGYSSLSSVLKSPAKLRENFYTSKNSGMKSPCVLRNLKTSK